MGLFGPTFNYLRPPRATPTEIWAATATASLSHQNQWCLNDLHVQPTSEGQPGPAKALLEFMATWYRITDMASLQASYVAEHFTSALPAWTHELTKWIDRGRMAAIARDRFPHMVDVRVPKLEGWVWVHQLTVVRLAYSTQIFDRATAGQWLRPPAQALQRHYGSWEELSDSIAAAREQWNADVAGRFDDKPLYKHPDSPFRHVPWSTPLGDPAA
ncbi:MAG: DUF1266 domain-containing protein [Kofleriaceae bacterium]|jgi:hypothetical protein|nr:DUF1266 domain-containing protein [Kofleriaceae bacterium]